MIAMEQHILKMSVRASAAGSSKQNYHGQDIYCANTRAECFSGKPYNYWCKPIDMSMILSFFHALT